MDGVGGEWRGEIGDNCTWKTIKKIIGQKEGERKRRVGRREGRKERKRKNVREKEK